MAGAQSEGSIDWDGCGPAFALVAVAGNDTDGPFAVRRIVDEGAVVGRLLGCVDDTAAAGIYRLITGSDAGVASRR